MKKNSSTFNITHFGKKTFKKKNLRDFLIPALLIVGAELFFIGAIYGANQTARKMEAEAVGHEIAAQIQVEMDRCVSTTVLLRDLYFMYEDSFLVNFNQLCEMFLEDNIAIGSMYFAPNGIVEYSYPGHVEGATHHFNMLEDPTQGPRARLARDSRKPTIAGPHALVEGGTGFIIRNPIYQDGKFIGFTICVIDRQQFIEQVKRGLNAKAASYDFSVWKRKDHTAIYDENGYILSSGKALKERDVVVEFNAPNDIWYLTLRPANGWAAWNDIILPIGVSLVLMVILLLGCFTMVVNSSHEQERLRLSENETIINQAGMGIWNVLVEEGKAPRLSISATMLTLLGFDGLHYLEGNAASEAEMYREWNSRIEESTRPALERCVEKMKRGLVDEVVYQWNHPTKGLRYVRCGGTSILDNEGNMILRGYHNDVTEAEMERAYQEQHEKDLLLQLKLVAAALNTVYPRVMKVNLSGDSFDLLSKEIYPEDELSGKGRFSDWIKAIAEHIPDDIQRNMFLTKFSLRAQVEAYYRGERLIEMVHQQEGADGVLHWMQTSAVFVENDMDDIVEISFARCVDDEIESEKMLMQATEEAERASTAKTDFLFSMSHDIRTPMNAIIGFTKLLQDHGDDPEKRKDYLKKIEQSSDYLLMLINNVLELARIESGKMELDDTIWNVEELGAAAVVIFIDSFKKKRIHFDYYLNCTHRHVYVDGLKLREIFLNLVSNALKYTPEGGTVGFYTDELPCEDPNYCIFRTRITDTGIGMSKEFLPHLFEDFSREHSSTDSKVAGTGLGMPIVKKLLDLMGGTITVESEVGKGTTFTIELKNRIVADEEIERIKEHKRNAEISGVSLKGKRILLAEDNDLNAEITIEILQDYGMVVERAEDGVQCISMLESRTDFYYDAILMDIQMPNMDGYKATEIIRAMDNHKKAGIPIFAMTANAFEEDVKQAITRGMSGHIAKPIDVQKMLQTLCSVWDNNVL